MSIGDRLRELRGQRSEADVAREVGITQSALSMYENDKRIPRDAVKVRLAKAFGTSVEAIFYADK